MKKTLLTLFAMVMMAFCATAQAAESKIIHAHDSNDYWHDYYYNAQNQLFWEIYGTTRREYAYNEAGQMTSMSQKAWVSATGNYTLNQQETYEYDADGNMSKKVVVKNPGSSFEATWTYTYSDYVNGVATYYDEYKNGSLYYMYKQLPEYDAKGNKVKVTVMYADPDKYENPTHATVDYSGKEAEYTWTYDENNVLVGENTGKVTYEYIYAELDASYAPTGLKAESDNELVTLTWNAVPGTNEYKVVSDYAEQIVYGTTFRTAVGTGDRQFTVQAIIDGIGRNAATVTATVVDPGKLPITNLAVGEITKTTEQTESPEAPTRDFFNIPLTWTLPEGHSEVEKYYVYYTSTRYGKGTRVTVSDKDATSFTLKIDPDEVAEWDTNGKPVKGVETPIYMTVVYVTGESESSNIVTINPYDQFYTGIKEVKNEELRVKNLNFYNLAGQRVKANNPARGDKSIIINNGKKVLK